MPRDVSRPRLVPAYGRLMRVLLRQRYITLAAAVAILIGSIGIVAGGRKQFEFIPSSDSETLVVNLEMPIGTALADTEAIIARLEQAAAYEEVSISKVISLK